MSSLLTLRNALKARKPHFVRQKAHSYKKIGLTWRRPRGLHSKLRLGWKGHPRPVEQGWRSPQEVRSLSREGLVEKIVYSPSDLDMIRKDREGIIIGSTVGAKKRKEILKKAVELKIKVLNIKDPAACMKAIDEKMARRKEDRKKDIKAKEAKKKEAAPKKDLSETVEEEQRKIEEKKEKDKLLTKKVM